MTLAVLERENDHPLTLSELLRYLGICLLMVTLQGWVLSKFWDYSGIARLHEDGPCPCNHRNYMTYKQFSTSRRALSSQVHSPLTSVIVLANSRDGLGVELQHQGVHCWVDPAP